MRKLLFSVSIILILITACNKDSDKELSARENVLTETSAPTGGENKSADNNPAQGENGASGKTEQSEKTEEPPVTPTPEILPPGTLPEPDEIPKTKRVQGDVVSAELVRSELSVYEYYYNKENSDERLVMYRSTGSQEFSEVIVIKTDFGGIDGLCDFVKSGEKLEAEIAAAANISFEEGNVYAYSAERCLEETEKSLDITEKISNANPVERYIIMTSDEDGCQMSLGAAGSISVFGNTEPADSEPLRQAYEVYDKIYSRFGISVW